MIIHISSKIISSRMRETDKISGVHSGKYHGILIKKLIFSFWILKIVSIVVSAIWFFNLCTSYQILALIIVMLDLIVLSAYCRYIMGFATKRIIVIVIAIIISLPIIAVIEKATPSYIADHPEEFDEYFWEKYVY